MFTKIFSVFALWLLCVVLFPGPVLAKETVRAAFLLLETGEDQGWSEAHAKGIDHARRVLGDRLEVAVTENVSAATALAAIRKHVEQGADIVFGTTFDFMDAMVAAAQLYPKVKFEHCSGYKTNPRNLGTYFARMYQAEYLAGYMAGLMGFVDVGTVGTEKLPETIRGINAFTIGLGRGLRESGTKHDPERLNVFWLGSWRDAEGEKRLARKLAETGHDLIRQMADTPDSAVAACRTGVPAIGYGSDARANGAECALVSTLFNWGPYYVRTLRAVLDGSWSPGAVWTGLNGKGVALSEFHPSVPLAVREKVLAEQARLEREGDDIFAGPLYSSNGKLLVKEGEKATDAELLSMQLFVRGVATGGKGVDDTRECRLEVMRTAVEVAAKGLGGVLAHVSKKEEQLVQLRAFVDNVRFFKDKSGYFYAYTMDCVNVAHATQKNLVGKDLRDYRDPAGKFVIRELAAAAKNGGGFVPYLWQKPGEEGEHAKVGYAAPIPGTLWFIGSGIYRD